MIELIIGMAVGSILMVGMVGVLFAASSAYNNWIDRVTTSGTGDVLAAAIIADSHHYVACSTGANELQFCYPHAVPAQPVVTYSSSAQAPYSVTRMAGDGDVADGDRRLLVRGLAAPLQFHVACREETTVDNGFVSVLGLPGRSELRIYFVAARGGCKNS